MKIFIASHKNVEEIYRDDIYEPLLVGSFNKKDIQYTRDDQGMNISEKNENYCELTGIYWIWKNSQEDIVGLCHYRRFLSKNQFSNSSHYYLNERDIRQLINENNPNTIILPKRHFYKGSIYENIRNAPNRKDIAILRKVIQDMDPDYLNDFDCFLKQNYAYLCNVMITSKKIFDDYSKWLFNILFETENRMDKNDYINDPYRKRLFGFLSERLLNVWIMHHKDILTVVEYALINIEINFWKKIKTAISQKIKEFF